MSKKTQGILRNRLDTYNSSKINLYKKKNRFKNINKDDQSITENQISPNHDQLLSETTRNSSSSQNSYEYSATCVQICQQIKDLILKISSIQKQMSIQTKARYSAFKETETQKRDENICKLSKEAVQLILKAQKNLTTIRNMRGRTLMEEKYYRNVEVSLAQEIRETSKSLRNQEKQYFERLKMYERGTVNNAIQLNTEDREKMRVNELQPFQIDEPIDQDQERSLKVQEIVKSINQLTTVYRQLNELVIHQGSLIDRIDFNIEDTFTHMKQGNQHLQGANKKAENSCATKCIQILMVAVVILAIILGFKYSA